MPVLCSDFPLCKPSACHCPLSLQAFWCLLDVCRWPRTGSQGNCCPSVTAAAFLVKKQHLKGSIPVRRKERSALAHAVLCWAGKTHVQARLVIRLLWECCLVCPTGLAMSWCLHCEPSACYYSVPWQQEVPAESHALISFIPLGTRCCLLETLCTSLG